MKFFKCFGKLHSLKKVECPVNIRRKISGHHRNVYPWTLSHGVFLSHILEWSKDFEAASGPLSSKRRTSEKLIISRIYILLESRGFRNFSCAPHDNSSFSVYLVQKEPVAWFALFYTKMRSSSTGFTESLLSACFHITGHTGQGTP